MTIPEMQRARVNGGELEFRVTGTGEPSYSRLTNRLETAASSGSRLPRRNGPYAVPFTTDTPNTRGLTVRANRGYCCHCQLCPG
jgi:hypothetical protein